MVSRTAGRLPAFVAESTLGKLAKWLRLAGIDTLYDRAVPDVGHLNRLAKHRQRIILTRTQSIGRKLPFGCGLLITPDEPRGQIQQVIRHFGIRRADLKPLSRCSACNQLLLVVEKEQLEGAVPEYIFQSHDRFRFCPGCRRIFWAGSHWERTMAMISQWFES